MLDVPENLWHRQVCSEPSEQHTEPLVLRRSQGTVISQLMRDDENPAAVP